MKIAITSDWHIGNNKGTYLVSEKTNRELDLEKQIEFMLQESKKKKIEWLLIAGDLFDKDSVDGYWFASAMDYLEKFLDNKIKILLIPGNHDWSSVKNPITEIVKQMKHPGIFVIECIEAIELGDCKCLCIPHIKKELLPDMNSSVKSALAESEPDIVLGHFQPTGSVAGSEEEMFAGSSRIIESALFNNGIVFSGHIHKPQILGKNIHIIGSPVRFNFGERREEKRFIIYDTLDSSIESIILDCQKMFRISIDLVTKDDFSLKNIGEKYKNALLGIQIKTTKENKSKVNWQYITNQFEKKQGGKIISKKLEIIKKDVLKKSNKEDVSPKKVFQKICNKIVENGKTRERIIEMGLEIINEAGANEN